MRHILLVEDNPGDVVLMQEAIRLSGFQAELLTAYDGEQAMKMLGEARVTLDCILLDINLPKLDGLTLLECYRDKFTAPVVCWTGSENPEDRQRAIELGVGDYVMKPVGFDLFLTTVHSLLERFIQQEPASLSSN